MKGWQVWAIAVRALTGWCIVRGCRHRAVSGASYRFLFEGREPTLEAACARALCVNHMGDTMPELMMAEGLGNGQ